MPNANKHIDNDVILTLKDFTPLSVAKAGWINSGAQLLGDKAKFISTAQLLSNNVLNGKTLSFCFSLKLNANSSGLIISNNTTSTSRIIIDISSNQLRCTQYGNNASYNRILTPILELNKWYDIVITINQVGTDVTIVGYVNGTLYQTSFVGITRVAKYLPIKLGDSASSVKNYEISNFNLYNRVLSAAEVYNLYNKTLYLPQPTTIFDETPCCFEGNNSAYVSVANNPLLQFCDGVVRQSFWCSIWVKRPIGENINQLIGKLNDAATTYEFAIQITALGTVYFLAFGGNRQIQLPNTIGTYHLLMYFDTTTSTLHPFINGVAQGSAVITMTIINPQITYPINFNSASGQTSYCSSWDARIGLGTLNQSQINDIYTGRAVGTERLWLPLGESAGNIRFDVSGNGLHGILKGTQDGKYNVGRQPKLDNGQYPFNYYKNNGGFVKALVNCSVANDGINQITWSTNVINSLNQWTIAIRLTGYQPKDDDFLFTNSGASNYSSIFLRRASGVGANIGWRNNAGVETSFGITSSSIQDNYKSLIFRSNGTNIFLSVSGAAEVSITPTNTVLLFNVLNGFSTAVGNGCNGYFWDLRTWNSDIGNTEALLYHSNTMTINADHQYSLIGYNPAKDLVGNIDGAVKAARPIAIPLQAATQLPVLPAMITTHPSQLPVLRDIKEVWRTPFIKGTIHEVYRNNIIVNGTVPIKQYGKVYGAWFNGNANNFISEGIYNNSPKAKWFDQNLIKDGLVVKAWVAPYNNGYFMASIGTATIRGFAMQAYRLLINWGTGVLVQVASAATILRRPMMYVGCVDREKLAMYVFDRTGLVGSAISTNQYYRSKDGTDQYSMVVGHNGASASPFKGYVFDISIMSAGILTLEEATRMFHSEKHLYGL